MMAMPTHAEAEYELTELLPDSPGDSRDGSGEGRAGISVS